MAPHAHVPAPRNTIETYSARPEREPPRNEKGEIVCQHESCIGKSEVFRRPCEWNKHMDKHERPYKCNEATCEQNPGFTYSGGLLRHMREVHKKGVGPARRPLFCPHANCIRSTGEGFTRRENLEEHLRRRHSYTGHYSPPPQSVSEQGEDTDGQPRKKRKTADADDSLVDGQLAQGDASQLQQLAEASRRDSVNMRTDPQLLAADRQHVNGDLADLDRTEAVRQLNLARQTIADQQELIRQQDYELQHLRLAVQNSAPGAPYARPPESNYPPFGSTSEGPPLELPPHEPPVDEQPHINGNGHDIQMEQGIPVEQQIQAAEQQQPKEDGPTITDEEAARRIEIAIAGSASQNQIAQATAAAS